MKKKIQNSAGKTQISEKLKWNLGKYKTDFMWLYFMYTAIDWPIKGVVVHFKHLG
jgi:hypothetical protein